MALDDPPLALQRSLDRLIRRVRLGPAPVRSRSRLLVLQIDGLSRAMLARAMAEGAMPFLEWLVRRSDRTAVAPSARCATLTARSTCYGGC